MADHPPVVDDSKDSEARRGLLARCGRFAEAPAVGLPLDEAEEVRRPTALPGHEPDRVASLRAFDIGQPLADRDRRAMARSGSKRRGPRPAIDWPALVCEGCVARDHEGKGEARDTRRQFVGQNVGETILRRIPRKIGEGRSRDWAVGKTRRTNRLRCFVMRSSKPRQRPAES
jgi:hypothetical protein